MQIGMVGLGRMGANMVRRLRRAGHDCVVFDTDPDAVAALGDDDDGVRGVASLRELAVALAPPRAVWTMVPTVFVGSVVDGLSAHLEAGDVVVDGGNSHWRDDVDRARTLDDAGVHYVDAGVSGGVFGLERGYCLMLGGEAAAIDRLRPALDALAPGVDTAERTVGREGPVAPAERGWLHCGPSGAGHFVKMVHNGIEYGVMAAYAEGLGILAEACQADRDSDAETAPLREPDYYRYDIDVPAVAEVWRRGSVIGSWLLDLTAAALVADPQLDGFAGRVSDSGEGRWTVQVAVDEGIPVHVLAAALFERFSSRGHADYAAKVLSAMRSQFGGHDEKLEAARGDDR